MSRSYQPLLVCQGRCASLTRHEYFKHQRFVVTSVPIAVGDGRRRYSFKLDPGSPKAEPRPVYSCLECNHKRIFGAEEI